MSTSPIHRWPRVRARKNGVHIVRGWYTVQWRFMILRRTMYFCTRFASGLVMLFSVMPLMGAVFNLVPEGTYGFLFMTRLIELRQWPLIELHARFPELTEQLWLSPFAPFNWAYLLVGFAMYHLSWLIAAPVTRAVSIAIPPLVKRRVTVRLDQERVRFLNKGMPWRFKRIPGVPLQFLCEQNPKPVHPFFGREPAFLTVMRYGHRKIIICGSMHLRDAERLALGLSYARDLCDGASHGFNEPEMPMPAMPTGW